MAFSKLVVAAIAADASRWLGAAVRFWLGAVIAFWLDAAVRSMLDAAADPGLRGPALKLSNARCKSSGTLAPYRAAA